MLKMNKIIDSFESIAIKHIQQDEQYVKDYIQIVNAVAPSILSNNTLKNLHNNRLFKNLNKDVRKQQYLQGFYSDYIYSSYYSNIAQIEFMDEHIKNAIEKNSEEIFNDNNDIWLSIRSHILSEYQKTIGSYKFMFRGIYPLITEHELSVIETVNLAIEFIDPDSVVEDNIDMIANYFNRKQRLLSETYKILMFTASFNNELSSLLFYRLDMRIVPYKRIAKDKKKQIKKLFWDEFGLGTPQGALRFMEYVEELDSDLEQIIKPKINEIKEVQESYANLVKMVDKPTLVTIEIINKMDEVYAYGENIRNILYKNKNYKVYIISTILYSGTFEIEEDKKSILWAGYIDIFKMEIEHEEIKSKMAENKDFLHVIMMSKSYIELPKNSRIKLAAIYQDADCLDDVILYGNEFAELYYSKIAGFESKHAAERFVEIISENNILLKSQSIYDNTYQLLIDPALKSKYTRMRNKQIEK